MFRKERPKLRPINSCLGVTEVKAHFASPSSFLPLTYSAMSGQSETSPSSSNVVAGGPAEVQAPRKPATLIIPGQSFPPEPCPIPKVPTKRGKITRRSKSSTASTTSRASRVKQNLANCSTINAKKELSTMIEDNKGDKRKGAASSKEKIVAKP